MENNYILEGNISVKAAVLANRRKIHKILVDQQKDDKDTCFILKEAKRKHIFIQKVKRQIIDELAEGKTHGGLLAYASDRSYETLEDIEIKEQCFFAILEGIEDPFNFGYMLRTLYAAGCQGVILPKRNWTSAANIVAKSSAGASEYIPIIRCDDMENICKDLQNKQIAIICGNRKDAVSLYDYQFPKKVCIAIGGEMRGLSKKVQTYSNQNVFIPYENDFRNSLNAVSATAVFAFEYVRQNINKKA